MPRHLALTLALALALSAAHAQPTSSTTDATDALALLRAQAPEHARSALLNTGDLDPNDPRAYHDLAIIELLWLQDPDAAAFLFASIASDDPTYDRLHNLGVAHAQARNYPQAINALERALTHPASPAHHQHTRATLADVQHAAGQHTNASALYLELYDTTDDTIYLYRHLLTRAHAGDTSDILQHTRRLSDAAGPHAPLLLAHLYRTANMPAYAMHELHRARDLALHDADFEAFTRASVLLAQHQWADERPHAALKTLHDVNLVARDPALRHTLGSIHLALGNPQDAYEAFTLGERLEQRADLDKLHTALLIGAILAANTAERNDEAFTLAHELERRHPVLGDLQETIPGASSALLTLALAHEARGSTLDATRVAATLDLDRLNPLDLNRLGDLHYRAGRYDLARQKYEHAHTHPDASANDRTSASRRIAYSYQAAGNLSAARISFEQHLSEAPYDTLALHHYGWVLAASGDLERARNAWSTALARGHEPSAEALERTRDH